MDAGMEARRREVRRLLADVTDWARCRDDVDAVALVGSYAREQAHMLSDVDVVVLGPAYADLADDVGWFLDLRAGSALIRSATWGSLLERRFRLTSGLVVELGLAPTTWARLPLDPGTHRVLSDGHRVLHDPHELLLRAEEASRTRDS